MTDGRHRATGAVVATGDTVTVTVDRPWVALRALRSAELPGGAPTARAGSVRSTLPEAAGALSVAGLRVAVVGPAGPLVTLGDGVRSTIGRLVTGSGAVSFRLRGVPGVRRGVRFAAAAVAAAAVVATLARVGHTGRYRRKP